MGERATPLAAVHRALGARLTSFAGWQMPLHYEGAGVIAEHRAVRTSAGVFDVSHLGKLRVGGPRARDALQTALTADVVGLAVGRATYSLVLTDDGGCIDDVFVYRLAEDEWLVVPNASNVNAVARAIEECGANPEDEWDRWAILAVQGPASFDVFERAFPGSGAPSLKLHRWGLMDLFGRDALVARTGYTGEKGFELYAPSPVAPDAFRALLGAGAAPVGLGARDTLRLEMGYALYGHELTLDINPLEAGLGWVLAWDTGFRGRDALAKVRAEGARRALFGIVCRARGVPRQGHTVYSDDVVIGEVTSGNHSPTLNTGIALALGDAELLRADAGTVAIDARGRFIPGDIVEPPFIPR